MWSCWGRLLPSGSAIGPSLTSPGWYSHESQNPNFLSIIMITMILSFWLSKLVISKMLMSKINIPNCPATDWRPFQGLCPASCHMVPGISSSPPTTLIRTSRRQWMDELPKLLFFSYMKKLVSPLELSVSVCKSHISFCLIKIFQCGMLVDFLMTHSHILIGSASWISLSCSKTLLFSYLSLVDLN